MGARRAAWTLGVAAWCRTCGVAEAAGELRGRGFAGAALHAMKHWIVARSGMSAGAAAALHPAGSVLQSGSESARTAMWVGPVVLAPVCEELLYRGLLWRHLRSLTGRLAWLARPIPAALVSGFVFATLHPQGVLAIPVLLAEGVALAMVRDWRGSLIACMTLHALQNALLMAFIGTPG